MGLLFILEKEEIKMTQLRKPETYYAFHLQKYFNEFYFSYEETVEFYVNPDVNKWHFIVPELGFEVWLTCYDDGRIVERRERKG